MRNLIEKIRKEILRKGKLLRKELVYLLALYDEIVLGKDLIRYQKFNREEHKKQLIKDKELFRRQFKVTFITLING